MADINRVILVGRLTRDAELKYTGSGIPVCTFSIAVNRRRKNGETWEDEASFFDIVLWGRMGETLNQYLVKGKQVCVEGELRQNRWEQDGQPRSKVEIIATNFQLVGGNPGGASMSAGNAGSSGYSGSSQNGGNYQGRSNYQSRPQNAGQNYQKQQPPAENYGGEYDDAELDNIPF